MLIGGTTGQESIYNALKAANELSNNEDDIVLIHDGVRPIIDSDLIVKNIENVKKEWKCNKVQFHKKKQQLCWMNKSNI